MQAKTKSAIKLGVVLALIVLIAVCGLTGSLRIGKYRFYPFSDFLRTGLDLGGGVTANLAAQDASLEGLDALLDEATAMLRARLAGMELNEADAVRQGDGVRVDIPASNGAKDLLEVLCSPGHVEFLDASGNVVLEGGDLASVKAVVTTNSLGESYPALEFRLVPEAVDRFVQDTEALAGQTISVYVDGAFLSSATVDAAVVGGVGYIPMYNYATYAQAVEASRLYAAVLDSGELPLALTDAGAGEVSPQAGANAARLVAAALCAALAVAAAMLVVRYRLAGVAGALALAIWALVAAFLLCELPDVTLTLSAVAGLLPGLGCATGGSALLIRRCLRHGGDGRAPRSALRAGFRSSVPALLDAGAVTLVAAALLYWLGSGPVRAFAVALLVSCLSALAVLLLLFRFLLSNVLNLAEKPFAFVPAQKRAAQLSGALRIALPAALVIAAVAMLLFGVAVKPGYDFGGGAAVRFALGEQYATADVEAALAEAGIGDYQIARLSPIPADDASADEAAADDETADAATATDAASAGDGLTDVEIRVPSPIVPQLESAQSELEAALAELYPQTRLVSFQTFSAAMDGDTALAALWALLAACLCAAIYAAIRFGLGGGAAMFCSGLVSAIVACALACVFGWAFRAEMSLLSAAAFAGVCSLSASALALNRLRETQRAPGASRLSRADIAQTCAADIQGRALAANLPMLLCAALLLIVGPLGVRAQGFALLAGCVGSVFAATQLVGRLWARLDVRKGKKAK